MIWYSSTTLIIQGKWSKYQIHKSKPVSPLNIDNSEIFDAQIWTTKERCGQVPAGSKHHLPIIIHPSYLCIRGTSQ